MGKLKAEVLLPALQPVTRAVAQCDFDAGSISHAGAVAIKCCTPPSHFGRHFNGDAERVSLSAF